ncbi:hypothetical protein E2C01_026620 [Portunus trituberculatus]|uniref:Uncharacterized protein n=1 Tax=Portunus trituberculatus TaxID=210409 RepID=A0A5B7EIN2_PORTR|nr:hypothetical protein [Portunus trituberculatus]
MKKETTRRTRKWTSWEVGAKEREVRPNPARQTDAPPPQPPSGEQGEDEGWVTKEKRRRRSPAIQLVLPKDEQTTTSSAALRESPIITRLREERRTGKIHDFVLNGVYVHDEDRFVGNIRGYNSSGAYTSHRYPKD